MEQPYIAKHLTQRVDYQKHRHFHDVNQILFSLNSDCSYFLDSRSYLISPGALIFIPAGIIHTMVHHNDERDLAVNTYTIHYDPSILKNFSTRQSNLYSMFANLAACIQLPEQKIPQVISLFERCKQMPDYLFGNDIHQIIHFLDLLLELCPYVDETQPDRRVSSVSEGSLSAQIIDYIGEHLGEPISLDSLASRFFISKFNLCRMFKRDTGFTVMEYVISSRIQHARELLRNGTSVQEASVRVGFSSSAHFVRTFQKVVGVTPGKYASDIRHAQKVSPFVFSAVYVGQTGGSGADGDEPEE